MNNNEKNEELEMIKKATGNKDISFIGLDDTFNFKCQQCGKCCMNRDDIVLNPFDVYNASKYLNITPEEFILNYTYSTLGANSKIPMVLLRSTENGFCPLLKFDIKDGGKFKCMIHSAKPGACGNHPIGVIYGMDKDTKDTDTQYIKVEQCPNSTSDETHTVREWIQPYLDNQKEIDIAHKMQTLITEYIDTKEFWMLMQMNAETASHVEKVKEEGVNLIESVMKKYITTTIYACYVNYDINKPFIEQAEENIKDLREFYEDIKKIYDHTKNFFDSCLKDISDKLKRNDLSPDEIMEMLLHDEEGEEE